MSSNKKSTTSKKRKSSKTPVIDMFVSGARKRADRGFPFPELKIPKRVRRKPTKSAAEKAVEKLMNGFKTVRNFVKNGGRKKKPRAKARRRNLRNTA